MKLVCLASTTLLDELEDDLTRVDNVEVLGGCSQHGRGCEFCTTNTVCPRVFNPVETDDESDNEEISPQAHRVPDQAQSGRHATSVILRFAPPEQHDTRVVWWYFLEGRPWTGLNRKSQTPLQPLLKTRTRTQCSTTPSELQWTATTSPTLTMTQFASLPRVERI